MRQKKLIAFKDGHEATPSELLELVRQNAWHAANEDYTGSMESLIDAVMYMHDYLVAMNERNAWNS